MSVRLLECFGVLQVRYESTTHIFPYSSTNPLSPLQAPRRHGTGAWRCASDERGSSIVGVILHRRRSSASLSPSCPDTDYCRPYARALRRWFWPDFINDWQLCCGDISIRGNCHVYFSGLCVRAARARICSLGTERCARARSASCKTYDTCSQFAGRQMFGVRAALALHALVAALFGA